jgi:hypothetical protein
MDGTKSGAKRLQQLTPALHKSQRGARSRQRINAREAAILGIRRRRRRSAGAGRRGHGQGRKLIVQFTETALQGVKNTRLRGLTSRRIGIGFLPILNHFPFS